ncbi:MAG TPA: Yip1 family protein [Tahibacter sp.]|uniref:Yip1 family protein n=1 Tax=Tahibacter sp. TaxID=2056211 RepID=UPI002C444E04|nr:Yip1 family protein [Tahibacter sp.]HSX60776.1 Yip1 family protein [Tahibacter sp.]
MDINKMIERIKNVLLSPKTEWPVIAQEQTDIAKLYTGYIMILAAIPAVFGFLSSVVFSPMGFGLAFGVMIFSYAVSLGMVFVIALIIDALAPTFGAQKSQIQALKTVAYAYTASWVAGVFLIIPFVGWIISLAGGIYSLVQLYFALPHTMKSPPERTGGYFAVILVISIVLSWIIAAVVATITIGAALSAAAVAS